MQHIERHALHVYLCVLPYMLHIYGSSDNECESVSFYFSVCVLLHCICDPCRASDRAHLPRSIELLVRRALPHTARHESLQMLYIISYYSMHMHVMQSISDMAECDEV